MALFRRGTPAGEPQQTSTPGPSRRRRSAGSSRLGSERADAQRAEAAAQAATADASRTGTKKDRPTPTRREAEAARRQRVNRTLTPKEARRLTSRQNREQRMRTLNAREAVPERALMRDYVDSRFNLGEFLLPSLVVILALSFLSVTVPRITAITTLVMYLFILGVLFDSFLLWRGFKRVLAERLPGAPTRGLMMYGVNRAIQIRRFRMPAPRLKRGDRY